MATPFAAQTLAAELEQRPHLVAVSDEVGSSRISTRGLRYSALAISTSCRRPSGSSSDRQSKRHVEADPVAGGLRPRGQRADSR